MYPRAVNRFRIVLLAALASLAAVACGEDRGFPDGRTIDAEPAPGTFTVAWTLADDGTPVSCADAGASSVVIGVRLSDSPTGANQVFSCNSGQGTSQPLAPGDYDLTYSLRGAGGTIATVPVSLEVPILAGQNTTLDPQVFPIDAQGQFALDLTAMPTGNCTAPAQGGAGLTAMTLTLTRSGTCQPVTYTVPAGATQPAGSYALDCMTQVRYGCVETDQHVTSSVLPSGEYVLSVVGDVGATPCWTGNRTVRVPTGGATTSFDVFLTKLTTAGC